MSATAQLRAGDPIPDNRPDYISVEHALAIYNAPDFPIPNCESRDCEQQGQWCVRVGKTDDSESWVLCDEHMVDVVRENREWDQ